jgi:hypothetical protein
MNELRNLADRAWRTGNYHAGVALDRAADLLDQAEKLREQAQAHQIAATARLDQLQAQVRDLTNPPQDRPRTASAARNAHLTDQILAFLAIQSPLPASTPTIHAALQPPAALDIPADASTPGLLRPGRQPAARQTSIRPGSPGRRPAG